jgi:predicted DsbA family dithiol-disulfide isomerase
MLNITYWSDYACPFCYIGEARLKKALKELGLDKHVRLVMKAFELDPGAGLHAETDTLTRFAQKYGLSEKEAASRIEEISRMGRAEGLDFKYATTLFTNTMDAHRMTKLAQSKEDPTIADRVIDALFRLYFTENRELADKALLQKIGEECGLIPEEVCETLATDKYKRKVLADEREAALYNVHAVPFFIVGRYGIPGALSVEDLKKVIEKTLEESIPQHDAKGMTCGPDSCSLG